MSIKVTRPEAYADLGDVWLRDQTARLLQKHLQFGQHFRLDVDLLLAGRARAARVARAAVSIATSLGGGEQWSGIAFYREPIRTAKVDCGCGATPIGRVPAIRWQSGLQPPWQRR
jgi:hypothetical protein